MHFFPPSAFTVSEDVTIPVTVYMSLQDGKLTTEELLRALVLDGAVGDDAVDADVYSVFDK
jgi:hypothetical protein